MAVILARPLDPLRRFSPLLLALMAVLIDLMPLPSASPLAIAPSLTLCVLFYWSIHRPELLGPVAIFLVCLLLDAVAGLPLGLTACAALLARALLGGRHRLLQGYGFAVLWACFVPVAVLVLSLRWALVCLVWWRPLAYQPVAIEILLTIAAYPLVGYGLGHVQLWLDRRHAPRS